MKELFIILSAIIFCKFTTMAEEALDEENVNMTRTDKLIKTIVSVDEQVAEAIKNPSFIDQSQIIILTLEALNYVLDYTFSTVDYDSGRDFVLKPYVALGGLKILDVQPSLPLLKVVFGWNDTYTKYFKQLHDCAKVQWNKIVRLVTHS